MKESEKFHWAQYCSGNSHYIDGYYEHCDDKIFNLQLRYLVEALEKAQNLYEGNFRVEELLLILNLLCNSLETLAGVNIRPPNDGYTPPLIRLYKNTLKEEKGWDLEQEKPELLSSLKEMDYLNKNLCKHINSSNSRKELLEKISYENVLDFMDATKKIWLWILDKAFSGSIPKDQLAFLINYPI